MITAAVDLGKRVAGLAVFDEAGTLVWAGEVEEPNGREYEMARRLVETARRVAPEGAVEWVAEAMVFRSGKNARARDLRHLAAVAVRLPAPRKLYRAEEWKGNVPKVICETRILGALTDEEYGAVERWTKESADAIGIGLFHTRRLGRGMVG